MCGISGFYNSNANYTDNNYANDILTKMNKTLSHRGPDGKGLIAYPHCGLAHVRLSIIDLISGDQPMTFVCEGNSYSIVHNGEIYNMHAIKSDLLSLGFKFKTTSDTEIILKAYIAYGEDFVTKLNGIFAFAIYDHSHDKLLLYRDHSGVKPLFYAFHNNTLIFSSEIKGLFCFPDFKPIIDDNSLREVLGLGPAKTYGKGVFKGVREVLAGHFIVYSAKAFTDKCYWQLKSRPHPDDFDTTVDKVRFLVTDAIKMQMISDIPISTFLSGGIDSSIVTAICSSELQKQGKVLNTFSFDFEDNSQYFKANKFQPSIDRPYVDIMKDYCHTNHRYLTCSNDDQFQYLFDCVDARDLPCMADVESSMMYFCSKVVPFNKVTLTGECADEIFGGYPWFHKKECFDADIFPWSMDMTPRTCLLKDDVNETLDLTTYVKNAYNQTLAETPRYTEDSPIEKRRREIAWLNLKWFMVTLLDRMDRTSMHCGLEARVPFADYRIIEYLWNVPWDMKSPDNMVKGLLRKACAPFLPESIAYRKKCPYPKTYHPEYEHMLKEHLLDIINSPNEPVNSLLDKDNVIHWLDTPHDYGRPFYGQLMAGPQQIAYLLQLNYWLNTYR